MEIKEKQIKEMAKCMCHHNNNSICELLHTPCDGDCGHIIYYLGTAEKLLNLNYQKVDKDSVVLSADEFANLKKYAYKKGSKETAEKFANLPNSEILTVVYDYEEIKVVKLEKLQEIAEQFVVEVKEN